MITDNEGGSIYKYLNTKNVTYYAKWSRNTSTIHIDTTGASAEVYQKSPGFYSFPTVSYSPEEMMFDFNELSSDGYKCRVKISFTLVGVEDCYMSIRLKDGNGNQIGYTDMDNMLVYAGTTSNNVNYTFDIGSNSYTSGMFNFTFEARADEGGMDWTNSYKVLNFAFSLEFYKVS